MRKIFVDPTSYVTGLRDSILTVFDGLLHVDGSNPDLQLWQVDIECEEDEFTLNELEATKLRSLKRLNVIWPDQPPTDVINVYALSTGGTSELATINICMILTFSHRCAPQASTP
jgi:hypothetical protein